MLTNLKGCYIIEVDNNNETLWTWTYPSATEIQKRIILLKYADIPDCINFVTCKVHDDWFYIYTAQVFDSDTLANVKKCALVLRSTEYYPNKFSTFCRMLCKRYLKTGDPTVVLRLYLSVMTKGCCDTEENGTFQSSDFPALPEKKKDSEIIDLITMFGLESILIYTALLLNKRLFIYDHSLSTLFHFIETLPSLMSHRKMEHTVYPWVHLVPEEINELKRHNGYIAGTLDSSISAREDLFDIFVNVAAREVAIAPHAREVFQMTKTHKDIALFLVQLAENKDPNINNEIARKTGQLLTQLRSFATTQTEEGKLMISIETLRERQLPHALESFLFNLAVAENIMLL